MPETVINRRAPLSKQLPKRVVEVEMFKAGEQMDSDGDKARFTEEDLEDIVHGYDPSLHEAPLIIGHEQTDSTPALGWVRKIWRKGTSLWGNIELTPKAEKIISEGTFKKVSSSFYAPSADTNPNPGRLSLRHLALVSIPAVKGLAEFKEVTSDTITFNFSEQRSVSLFKDIIELEKSPMPDTQAKKSRNRRKNISNHGEGTVNLTINISPDAEDMVGVESDGKKLPVYDDAGNMLNEQGAPADYDMDYSMEEEDPSVANQQVPHDSSKAAALETAELRNDFADEEELPPEGEEPMPEGEEPEGDAPMPEEEGDLGTEPDTDPEIEGEGPEEPMPDAAPAPEAPAPEAPAPDAEVPPSAPEDETTEDISGEMEDGGGDQAVAQLASKYSAMELVKALALKKKNTDMMESDVTQTSSARDFSENPFGKKKKEDDEDKDCDDKEKNYSMDEPGEEETEEFADCDSDEKKFPFNGSSEKDRKNGNDDKQKSDDDDEGEDYSEDEDSKEDSEDSDIKKLKDRLQFVEEELQKQRRMAREKEISDFCESMYAGGKLIESIVPKKELVKFMSTLNGKNSINFSESNRKSQFDFFSGVLSNLPQVVNFSELATEASSPVKNKTKTRDELSGFAYDNKSAEVHAKALDFSESHGVDYITALKSVV